MNFHNSKTMGEWNCKMASCTFIYHLIKVSTHIHTHTLDSISISVHGVWCLDVRLALSRRQKRMQLIDVHSRLSFSPIVPTFVK